ncbi:MAG: phage virion morphogenesis protein [Magnetospirillum sp.]|nr:phage virion morphogenesis protein [Magnetospirillum sp.]
MAWTLDFALDDRDVRRTLMGYADNARDLSPVMERIGNAGMLATDQRFENEVDPDGRAWEALRPSTIAKKAKAGREKKLQWAGHLRRSFTRRVTANSVTWGTNLAYAAAHQFGATIFRAARTLLDSRISMRRAVVVRKTKAGDEFGYKALLFARAGDKRVVAMARRVVGEGTIVIPARPFAGINDTERQEYVGMIRDHVLGKGKL